MIRIYWAKQPGVFVDKILPLLLEYGELTEDDIESVFRKAGIKSYADSHIDLGRRIQLFEDHSEVYVLAPDAIDGVREGEGVRLSDFLCRVPQFKHWLEMKHVEDREVEISDILIDEERESQMRKSRSSLFSDWEGVLQGRLQTDTIRDLVVDQASSPFYIWDEYLFYKSKEDLPLRSAILCILGAAAQQGAAIKIENIARLLDVEAQEVESIIDDVLKPVGCPLTKNGGGYTLDRDIRYIVAHPEVASKVLRTSIDEEFDFTTSNIISDLAAKVEKRGSYFTFPGSDPISIDLKLVSAAERTPIYRFDHNRSNHSILDSLQAETQRKSRVIVPVGLEGREDSLLTAIRELLEAIKEGETRGIDARLQFHLRSRYEYLGAVPMLEPPNYQTLTELGEQFLGTSPVERRQFLQSIEFVCNPLLQSTMVLADRVDVAQRSDRWMASIAGSYIPFGRLLTDVLGHQGYEVISRADQSHLGTACIGFAKELRMIEVDSGTHNLSIQEGFGKNLRSGELGIFPFYNKVEQEISNCLPEVVEV